jgi:hypothetical protein
VLKLEEVQLLSAQNNRLRVRSTVLERAVSGRDDQVRAQRVNRGGRGWCWAGAAAAMVSLGCAAAKDTFRVKLRRPLALTLGVRWQRDEWRDEAGTANCCGTASHGCPPRITSWKTAVSLSTPTPPHPTPPHPTPPHPTPPHPTPPHPTPPHPTPPHPTPPHATHHR